MGNRRQFWAALVLLGTFALVVAWDQSVWWGSRDEYLFGYLVPIFVGYIVYDRWPAVRAALQEGDVPGPPGIAATLGFLAGLALLLGLGLFGLGVFYRAGAGPSQPGSLAIALGFALTCLSLLYLAAPAQLRAAGFASTVATRGCAAPDSSRRQPRMRLALLFLFPATVWLISAPLVSAVENSLSTFLLGKVTTVVFAVFDVLGYPLERHGSTLVLPTGQVGVAEACSGIRSLTGSVFSGCFLAAAFLRHPWSKLGLIGAAVVLAFLMNIVRSLVLTGVAYAHGAAAIEGALHDGTGFAVLVLTFLGLLGLLPLFSERRKSAPSGHLFDAPALASERRVPADGAGTTEA